MEPTIHEDRNDARAAASVVWLLGLGLICPFAHPLRLLGYGSVPAALVVAVTILFPGASIFTPILITQDFGLHLPGAILPIISIIFWALLLITFALTAFLLCIWQRDIVNRFRDPVGKLLVEGAGRLVEYLVAMAILMVLVVAVFIACGMIPITLNGERVLNGPMGLLMLAVATFCYARLSFIGPLTAVYGLREALRLAWRFGKRQAVGHLLVFLMMGLGWACLSIASTVLGLMSQTASALLVANATNIVVTLLALLWLTAVPAITVRRLLDLEADTDKVFD